MFRLLKKYHIVYWVIPLIGILTCLRVFCDFLIPTFMGFIIGMINDPLHATLILDIVKYSGLIVVAAISSLVLDFIITIIASKATTNIIFDVRQKIFNKVSKFSAVELNKIGVSSLVTRTTNDLSIISDTILEIFHSVFYAPLLSLGALTFLIIEGCYYELIIVIIISVVLIVLAIVLGIKSIIPRFYDLQISNDRINLLTKENIDGLRVVRAYNAEDFQNKKFTITNRFYARNELHILRITGILMPFVQLITGLMTIAICLVSAYLIRDPDTPFKYEQMAVVIQFGSLLLVGFVSCVAFIAILPRANICLKRVNEILDMNFSYDEDVVTPKIKEHGTIVIKNLTFRYPGSKKPSLSNINISIKKGDVVSLIGSTGSGKSTLLNLLQKMYPVPNNKIYINGVDINKYNIKDLTKIITPVPQKSYLFHDTIKNNLCLGSYKVSKKQIDNALKISQSTDFVNKLSGKLNYMVSTGGKNLSGGQRQRLCIARAIIKNPEIFLFDDSFSALDFITVSKINKHLKEESNKTKIIVTHRISTAMNSSKIIVFEKGKIVGVGNHDYLNKTCKIYREIVSSQLGEDKLK